MCIIASMLLLLLLLPLCHDRHAAALREAGAGSICIVNSEAGLNLGAQLLTDLGTSQTAIALLRRGIDQALVVRTAAHTSSNNQAAPQASGTAGNSDSRGQKRQVELFVLDGHHMYGLRAEALAKAVKQVEACGECPLVAQRMLESQASIESGSSSSNDSSRWSSPGSSMSGGVMPAEEAVPITNTVAAADASSSAVEQPSNGSSSGSAAGLANGSSSSSLPAPVTATLSGSSADAL
jgi:hypothetical protein